MAKPDFFASLRKYRNRIIVIIKVAVLLYLFLVSVRLLGSTFKLIAGDQARIILEQYTSNRFAGLFVGILATSLIQSSSTVTSIVVGFVGAGTLPLHNAVPIVIGANIGTTITNMIVSLGHIRRRVEFRKALAAATVHDFFNFLTTLLIFPLELLFSPLERISIYFTDFLPKTAFYMGKGPLYPLINPPVKYLIEFVKNSNEQAVLKPMLVVFAFFLLFASLFFMVKVLKGYMLARLESFFGRYVFRNPYLGLLLGMVITMMVQSSSVTTSLLVPMAGAGILNLYQIYPFTLGANLGTTFTALIAAMATSSVDGLRIALCHFMFNLVGIAIFFPLKEIPISMAKRYARFAAIRRRYAFLLIGLVFFVIPILIIVISEFVF
jgi:sodium-dependent phosphate cotransporter